VSYLDTPASGPAQADVNRIYDSARLGYLPDYTRGVFGLRPAAEPTPITAPASRRNSCGFSPSGDPPSSTTAQSHVSEEKSSTIS
jgi:hypothetical protein